MNAPSLLRPAGVLVLLVVAEGCSSSTNANSTDGGTDSGVDAGPIPIEGGDEGGETDGSPMDAIGSAGGPATGPIIGTPLATFDSNISGFRLDSYNEPANLAVGPTPPTLTWISTDGSPDPGCLKITAPYSAASQYVDLESPVFPAPLPNWSGKKMHVRIKLDPSSTFTGSPVLYVKTGTAYVFYPMAFVPYPQNSGWQEFVLPLVSPAPSPPADVGADPTQVITYGIHPAYGTVAPTTPTPVTFYVDSFSLE